MGSPGSIVLLWGGEQKAQNDLQKPAAPCHIWVRLEGEMQGMPNKPRELCQELAVLFSLSCPLRSTTQLYPVYMLLDVRLLFLHAYWGCKEKLGCKNQLGVPGQLGASLLVVGAMLSLVPFWYSDPLYAECPLPAARPARRRLR